MKSNEKLKNKEIKITDNSEETTGNRNKHNVSRNLIVPKRYEFAILVYNKD